MHVRGKGGRHVPILMSADIVQAIDILVSTRSAVGVGAQNLYLFAAPTRMSVKPLRGYQCIGNVIKRIPNLVMPERIRSTKLRKYVATVAQLTNLTEGEFEWLSTHLGHSLNVHKEHYRLHDSAIELSKISRLLIAVDNGNGKSIAGKSLDEIQDYGKSC